jgi:hypothetical protein
MVVVGQDNAAELCDLLAVEMGVAAIFAGDVGAQPIVELEAAAEREKRRAVELQEPGSDQVPGATTLLSELTCWLVIPISPRRYQPANS